MQPILDAGQAEMVSGKYEIFPGLVLEPAPGHTPGHMVLKVESAGEYGIFVGDIVHHPIQLFYPLWNSVFCEDAEQARSTRLKVLAYAAEKNALMFPAHFGGQHAVWVARSGSDFDVMYEKPSSRVLLD